MLLGLTSLGLAWTIAPSARASLFQFDGAQWTPAAPQTDSSTPQQQPNTANTGNVFNFSEEKWAPAEQVPYPTDPIQNATPIEEEKPLINKQIEASPEKEVSYTPPPHPPSGAFEVTVSLPTPWDTPQTVPPAEELPSFDIRLLDKNWKAPDFGAVNQKEEMLPINVRMTLLPPPPVPAKKETAKISAVKLGHIETQSRKIKNKKIEQPSISPANQAACAAIDAYKKKQLEAMQSDRQTLNALQEAVHSLNLNKQLDFILENAAEQSPVTDPSNSQTSSPPHSIN